MRFKQFLLENDHGSRYQNTWHHQHKHAEHEKELGHEKPLHPYGWKFTGHYHVYYDRSFWKTFPVGNVIEVAHRAQAKSRQRIHLQPDFAPVHDAKEAHSLYKHKKLYKTPHDKEFLTIDKAEEQIANGFGLEYPTKHDVSLLTPLPFEVDQSEPENIKFGIKINGRVWNKPGTSEPVSFQTRAHANKSAQTIQSKPQNADKTVEVFQI